MVLAPLNKLFLATTSLYFVILMKSLLSYHKATYHLKLNWLASQYLELQNNCEEESTVLNSVVHS